MLFFCKYLKIYICSWKKMIIFANTFFLPAKFRHMQLFFDHTAHNIWRHHEHLLLIWNANTFVDASRSVMPLEPSWLRRRVAVEDRRNLTPFHHPCLHRRRRHADFRRPVFDWLAICYCWNTMVFDRVMIQREVSTENLIFKWDLLHCIRCQITLCRSNQEHSSNNL